MYIHIYIHLPDRHTGQWDWRKNQLSLQYLHRREGPRTQFLPYTSLPCCVFIFIFVAIYIFSGISSM